VRPPQAPQRQHEGYVFVPKSARRRRRRTYSIEDDDEDEEEETAANTNTSQSQLEDASEDQENAAERERRGIFDYVVGSSEYCEKTLVHRELEFDNLWNRIVAIIDTKPSTRRPRSEMKGALMRCFMSCSGGR
jgi:uncharacterized lipoprotein